VKIILEVFIVMRKIAILLAFLLLSGAWVYAADCNSGGRYEDMGDGTVTDCRTGMIWLKNAKCLSTSNGIANPTGTLTWFDAMKWVAGLYGDGSGSTICGLTDGSSAGDWRLPTKSELMAMVSYAKKRGFTNPVLTNGAGTDQWTSNGDVFTSVQSDLYWVSTPSHLVPFNAWCVSMSDSSLWVSDGTSDSLYIWPVRGGQSGSFGSLIIE